MKLLKKYWWVVVLIVVAVVVYKYWQKKKRADNPVSRLTPIGMGTKKPEPPKTPANNQPKKGEGTVLPNNQVRKDTLYPSYISQR